MNDNSHEQLRNPRELNDNFVKSKRDTQTAGQKLSHGVSRLTSFFRKTSSTQQALEGARITTITSELKGLEHKDSLGNPSTNTSSKGREESGDLSKHEKNVSETTEKMNEPTTDSGIEIEIMKPIMGKILTELEFDEFRKQHKFGSGRRGTWRSVENGVYLYAKSQYLLKNKAALADTLDVLKFLTAKGILYPKTQWGVIRTAEGEFGIFGLTRELIPAAKSDDIPEHWQKPLLRSQINSTDINDWYNALLSRSDSHVLEWLTKRLSENADVNVDSQLMRLLNFVEASHLNNWGRDPETGRLYPIDIEVISVNRPREQAIIKAWKNNEIFDVKRYDELEKQISEL